MTNEEIMDRFDEGSRHFAEIRGQLADVLKALEPLPQMKLDIEDVKKDSEKVKDLVEAWNAVKTGGKFIKWVAPIIGSIVGGWAALKAGMTGFFR